jgi:NADH-quinone oxidoreductase subunit F
VKGLWGRPTNINNVETYATIPHILRNGGEWYAQFGSEKSKGTKTFCLVGKVVRTGLVEVPLGTKLREVVYSVGGGLMEGKEFKAAQTGGPSGGCLPASTLDLPIDYESLAAAGSIMGSGGLIVMDDDTCPVDMTRYFLAFTQRESCGKCVPCRVGTRQMLGMLEAVTRGESVDLDYLEKMARNIHLTSLCGLGQTAPNPVLTTLRYFRNEYEAHIREKRCPALVCKALTSYYILPEKCRACLICMRDCPVQAIVGGKNQIHVIDQAKCTKCGTCLEVCPLRFGAVTRLSGVPVPAPPPPEKLVLHRAK